MQQAEDRAHRIGQTQSVSVHILICKDSIDELMWETLQAKLATTGQVLDGQAGHMEVSGVRRRERRAYARLRCWLHRPPHVWSFGLLPCAGGPVQHAGQQSREQERRRLASCSSRRRHGRHAAARQAAAKHCKLLCSSTLSRWPSRKGCCCCCCCRWTKQHKKAAHRVICRERLNECVCGLL
jgi:hypothetical protein